MSTERILLVDNLLDRVDRLEEQVGELASYALTPQDAAPDTGEDNFRLLSGWVVDGRVLRDVGGFIILDPSLPAITIAQGGRIKSSDYVAGVSGFDINGGVAEFNDVTVRGTIYANAGLIGGWTIATGHLYAGSGAGRAGLRPADYPFYAGAEDPASAPFRVTPAGALVASNATVTGTLTATAGAIGGWTIATGHLYAGSGAGRAGLRPADYPFYAGAENPASAPFRVTPAGTLTATNADIAGTVDANAGHLGSLDVDGVITVGSAAPYIEIDGVNKRIQSSTFSAGLAGMRIEANGDAEFNNVTVRGALASTVFVRGLVDARAGTLVVVKSAGVLAADMAVPGAGTWNMYVGDPPGGGFLFANNDICRCKSEYSGGIADVWFTVAGRTDMGDGTQRYTCTYQSGTRGIAYPAGGPALDYGVSGDGGVLQTADLSNAPYLSIFTHAGAPWSTISERLRLGNLAGWQGAGLSGYGIAIGDYSGNEFAYYTPGTGLVVRGTVRADDGYLATLSVTGTLTLSGSGKLITAASPSARIELSTTELAGYSDATTKQFYWSAADGKAYAGGGVVVLDSAGIGIDIGYGSYLNERAYKFTVGGSTYARLAGRRTSGLATYVQLDTYNTTDAGIIEIVAYGYSTIQSRIQIYNTPGSGAIQISPRTFTYISGDVRAGSGLYVGSTTSDPPDDDIVADGGIYLGRNADPGDGNVAYTGVLKSYKNSTEYTAYAYVPLGGPLTSTSWDGDAKSAATTIDLQSVFGAPANVKACNFRFAIKASSIGLYGCIGYSPSYYYHLSIYPPVATLLTATTGVSTCDSNGDVYFNLASSLTEVHLQIFGYYL